MAGLIIVIIVAAGATLLGEGVAATTTTTRTRTTTGLVTMMRIGAVGRQNERNAREAIVFGCHGNSNSIVPAFVSSIDRNRRQRRHDSVRRNRQWYPESLSNCFGVRRHCLQSQFSLMVFPVLSEDTISPLVNMQATPVPFTWTTTILSDAVEAMDNENILLLSSWRQYVPLIVSCAVIVDILLGSPLAKACLSILSQQREDGGSSKTDSQQLDQIQTFGGDKHSNNSPYRSTKERVNSKAIADAAIQKARYTLDLQEYLRTTKTDQDKIKEVQRTVDLQLDAIDETLSKLGNKER